MFSLLLPIFPGGVEALCVGIYFTAAVSMSVAMISFDFWHLFLSFLVLEGMVGMFNSCGAILRSKYYPDGQHSSIMSVFRLPLNLLVVVGTKITDNGNSVSQLQFSFFVVFLMHVTAMCLQLALVRNPLSSSVSLILDSDSEMVSTKKITKKKSV